MTMLPWGEITIHLDEFIDIVGLSEPLGVPSDIIVEQFIIDKDIADIRNTCYKLPETQNWPILNLTYQKYMVL